MKERLVVIHPSARACERWAEDMAALLPDLEVGIWRADDPRSFTDADWAVGWAPDAAFFAAHPRLRAFFGAAAGVDHLLKAPGLPPQLALYRLEDAGMGPQMAEYCCHEVIRLYRRWDELAALQREGVWKELRPERRADFPVGVLGMGVLGTQVARALVSFGYVVNGHSRTPKDVEGVRGFHGDDQLDDFLAASRVLCVLAPLTEDTRDLLDARRLSRLRPGGWVINVARGGIIVDADLLAQIDAGHLAGATLDVFRQEPLPAGHPFWSHPRIRMSPHVAAMTLVRESAEQVADKLRLVRAGGAPGGRVDRARGY